MLGPMHLRAWTCSIAPGLLLLGCAPISSAPVDGAAADAAAVGGGCPTFDPGAPPLSPGPYDHELHYRVSVDGRAFGPASAVMVEHASAPDAVTGPGGSPWVYFVNGSPGQAAIFIAREASGGAAWEVFDCVRLDGAVDPSAVDPDVVALPGGRLRLFYNPLVPANPTGPNPIVSAISSDGVHFVREGTVIAVPGGINPTAVRLADGSWLMAIATEATTYLAASGDGAAFTITQEHPAGIPELAYDAERDEVRFYIAERSGLTVRTSADGGATWSPPTTLTTGPQDPSVHRAADGRWVLYYRVEGAAP